MVVYLNCTSTNGEPAARAGDTVSCPLHGTVHIVSGSPNTCHNGQPAARVGDKTSCGATIIEGSDSVYINGRCGAFVGCATTHGGEITSGAPTVFIGKRAGGADLDKYLGSFSIALDLSSMHEAGNHNGESYTNIAVEIMRADGTYLTMTSTDEYGITRRFYTKEQEEVVAWLDFGHWEISEEFEAMDCDDVEEDR